MYPDKLQGVKRARHEPSSPNVYAYMPTSIAHLGIIMDGNRRWAKERGFG
jgi:undecaprenyl pyrophosphate synthase